MLIFSIFFVFSFLAYLCLWIIIRNINLKYSFIDELFNEKKLIHNVFPAICMALISSIGCVVTPVRNICKYIIFHMFNFHLWLL